MKNILKATILALTASVGLSSCNDFFDLKPSNEMVLDEFWQTESDVLSVTGACYRAMQEPGFMQRLMVWGEFRGDNVVLGTSPSGDLRYIGNLNILPSNGFARWGDFYNVINICNTVEHFAPQVYDRDPNFSLAKMRAYIAEVKTIRAFCYFTLVRTFRDVPLVTEPTVDDTAVFQIPQSDPDELIDFLIDDLKAVENDAVETFERSDYTKGRFTRSGLRALLADMLLWRERYQECADYCDLVINDAHNVLTLVTPGKFNQSVFVNGNSSESIMELQFSRSNIPNYTVCEFYGRTGGHSGWGHQQMAAFDFKSVELFESSDIRNFDFFYRTDGMSSYPIKKYLAYRKDITKKENIQESDYENIDGGTSNWIIYRLPDVMLMKAEALTELDTQLETAFNLVNTIHQRSNPDAATQLVFSDYENQSAMRDLVFDERQRELMFEGKRYYDILRRIRRDITQFQTIVNKYLLPKYATVDQSTAIAKLSEMNGLYMPIHTDELISNKLLEQNPFYKLSSSIEKN